MGRGAQVVWSIVAVFIMAGIALAAGPSTQPSTPAPGRQVIERRAGYNYWIYLPPEYEKQERWPLVVFLHGVGLKRMQEVKLNAPAARVDAGEQFPFVLVSPFWGGVWWKAEELVVLVDTIATRYKIDPHRIYLTGLSLGGYGTWDTGCRHPDRFAAIAPLCGWGKPELAGNLKNVPVWAFHGAKDTIVPIRESQRMVDGVKKAGGDVQFTILADAAHVCWPPVYADNKIYEWLLSHRKATAAPIDADAELRHDLKRAVHVRTAPLLAGQDKIDQLSSSLEIANNTDVAVRLRGELSAELAVRPRDFDVVLQAGARRMLPVELTGRSVPADRDGAMDVKWTATSATTRPVAVTASRHFPISRIGSCPRLGKRIEVDGKLEDWPVPLAPVTFSFSHTKAEGKASASDCSALMAMAWDDQLLYVAVRVLDDSVQTKPDRPVWEQDGIELRLDVRPPPRSAAFGDWQEVLLVLVAPSDDPLKPTVWRPDARAEKKLKDVRIASRKTDRGYDTEIAVPLSDLKPLSDGRQFRINLAVNDFDGHRPIPQYWRHPDWRLADMEDDGLGTFELTGR